MRIGPDTRTARIVVRPSASRAMTSGGIGGGGPLNEMVGPVPLAGAGLSGPDVVWARAGWASRRTASRHGQPRRTIIPVATPADHIQVAPRRRALGSEPG